MDFLQLVRNRNSVRVYEARPVEPSKLSAIVEAASRAPSAGNLQAYEIVAVETPSTLVRLAAAARGQQFVATAPVALVFCALPGRSEATYGRRGAELYCVQDATIACAYAQLAAAALGLGTTWVGAFDPSEVREAVQGGADAIPVAILPIGYPAEQPEITPRRELRQLVRWARGSVTRASRGVRR